MDIDFVILWVDGSDKAWLEEKRKYTPNILADDSEIRYRDWGLLKYWFRSVERFAPWVRKIHFVTWGMIPEWLDCTNPKLHIVRHEDYVPEEKLPLFNSSALECFLHRIPGLAEHFVYFNDDMFILKPLRPEVFFKNGLPCDMMAFQPVIANPANSVMSHIYLNHSLAVSRNFVKRECVKRHPSHFFHLGYPFIYWCYNLLELAFPQFTGFYTVHGPSPFLKQTFEDAWEKEGAALEAAGGNRFRSSEDLSQYFFREWQKLSGNFIPRNAHKDLGYFEFAENTQKLETTITGQKKRMICINDRNISEADTLQNQHLLAAFQKILPEKSTFEK